MRIVSIEKIEYDGLVHNINCEPDHIFSSEGIFVHNCGAGDHFVRSLNAEEIASQSIHLIRDMDIKAENIKSFQIMFMSMGEPMLNYGALSDALYTLVVYYPTARLLISTSGPKSPDYIQLIKDSLIIEQIGLQFSVHESTDEARNKLIPLPGKLSLAEIAEQGKEWFLFTERKPFFNYCVHVANNTDQDVERLHALFDPRVWNCTISVICERDESVAAANARQRDLASTFASKMVACGYDTRVFDPVGQEIGSGCGQLFQVQKWMVKHPNLAKKSVGFGKEILHTPR